MAKKLTHAELIQEQFIYHGNLRDETEGPHGGYGIVFIDTFQSQKGNNMVKWSPVDNPGFEQVMIAENENIFAKLSRLKKNEGYVVRGYGARGGAAVRVFTVDGEEVDLTPVAGSTKPYSPPPQPSPQQVQAKTSTGQQEIEDKLVESLVMAHHVATRFQTETGSDLSENVRTLGTTIFIERNRKGV